MKKSIARGLAAGAVGAFMALGLGQAHAAPTPVEGVIVGGPGETTFKFSNLTESFIEAEGDNLFGFGQVTQINTLEGDAFCVTSGCELTYAFSGYEATTFSPSAAVFEGGSVSFYLDATPDSDLSTTEGFEDGTLWLSLVGFPSEETSPGPNQGETGTLFSTGVSFADSENIRGFGTGILSITGGAAADYFGIGTLVDLSSSFQPSPEGWELPLSGTAELQVTAPGEVPPTPVPEPATLALLGMGLLGLGAVSRSRKQCSASL